ncbi:MAG TPA: phosphonate ABC transporter, permease protein PhnE [Bryobacteraceae bacterium]|nr:phosphonate ABC transporter, permease protein PhnE [Bryobacteraceae bacterium]
MNLGDFSLGRYRRRVIPAAVFVAIVIGAALLCEVSFSDFVKGIVKGLSLLTFFFPPDWAAFPEMIRPALVTIVICLIATPIGAAFSIVFGLAGARNIAPDWLRLVSRSIIAAERGLPEIVTLLVLVAAFGLGPLAGVMALAIGSIGMLGKLLADAIEEIDPRILDATAAVGATHWQVIRHAVLPEVLPSLVANSIFRFEVNIRASVLLGAVGAGGIGYELNAAINQLEYSRATVAALLSLLLVFLSERLSDRLRSRIIGAGRLG